MEPENADGWKRHEEEIRETFTNNPFFGVPAVRFGGFSRPKFLCFFERVWHTRKSTRIGSGTSPLHSCRQDGQSIRVNLGATFKVSKIRCLLLQDVSQHMQFLQTGVRKPTKNTIQAFGLILYIHTSRMNMTKRYVLPCTISLYLYKRIIRVFPIPFQPACALFRRKMQPDYCGFFLILGCTAVMLQARPPGLSLHF